MRSGPEQVQRVPVWGGWLRLAHWSIAVSTLLLLASGEILKYFAPVDDAIRDYHIMLGSVLTLAVLLRVILLFVDSSVGRWQALVPSSTQWSAMAAMLRFYLSFARTPLPNWYAHNPLWIPAYVLLYGLLLVQLLSGFWQASTPFIAGFYLPDVHSVFATLIMVFTGLHLVAVFLHDLKGTGSDVSAMINGHRIFVIRKPEQPGIHRVSLDQIPVKRKTPNQS